jgi:hypothetical protein
MPELSEKSTTNGGGESELDLLRAERKNSNKPGRENERTILIGIDFGTTQVTLQ